MRFISHNPSDTKRFAKMLATRLLVKPHRAHAAVIALSGDLGAGKTTLAQGFARALGIKQRIASPTFVIFRSYALPVSFSQKRESSSYANFYHFDAYRIRDPKELLTLGFKKILSDPKNIVLIEWPENVLKLLPRDALMVCLEHGKKASERVVEVRGAN